MLAALFPGQGSQHPGMGRFLYDEFQLARELFEEASDAISVDLKKLCFDGSDSDLALTENTQPCLVLVSSVSYLVLDQLVPLKPVAAAGHSVGEYAANVAAGSLKFADAIRAVRLRGRAMQEAVPVGKGGMLAVLGLTPAQVETLCSWVVKESGAGPLEAANFNAPGQVVISGDARAIKWLTDNYKPDLFAPDKPRTKFIPLKVSAPFHCSMMKPAEEKMASVLNEIEFQIPKFPVVANVSAKPVDYAPELRRLLIEQISAPVRWVECVEQVKALGGTEAVEFGSGKVLSGLVKKIDSENIRTLNITTLEELKGLEKACST